MGFFSRMLGIEDESDRRRTAVREQDRFAPSPAAVSSDQQALDRYHYMLRTAPPETIEQAHAEAFAKLSTEQRQKVLAELASASPAAEQASVAATPVDDPRALARVATRAEVRSPGVVERSLGGGGMMGMGASLLSSFAMGFVGSMVAQSFMSAIGGFGDEAPAAGAADETADDGQLAENDAEGQDYSDDGGDFGGDFDV